MEKIKKCQVLSKGKNGYTTLFQTKHNQLVKLYTCKAIYDEEDILRDIETLLTIVKNQINLPKQFIMPKCVLRYQEKIIGYSMPFIKGNTLAVALKKASVSEAALWLRQIYEDILLINNLPQALSFCDLHEDNILLDNTGKLHYCDVDGFCSYNNKAKHSRYLMMSRQFFDSFPAKYKKQTDSDIYLANQNTDIACLVIMFMNYLMNDERSYAGLTAWELVNYFAYLQKAGLPLAIIEMLKTLYSEQDNYFDMEAINCLPDEITVFSYKRYLEETAVFHNAAEAILFLEQKEYKYGGENYAN